MLIRTYQRASYLRNNYKFHPFIIAWNILAVNIQQFSYQVTSGLVGSDFYYDQLMLVQLLTYSYDTELRSYHATALLLSRRGVDHYYAKMLHSDRQPNDIGFSSQRRMHSWSTLTTNVDATQKFANKIRQTSFYVRISRSYR